MGHADNNPGRPTDAAPDADNNLGRGAPHDRDERIQQKRRNEAKSIEGIAPQKRRIRISKDASRKARLKGAE
jgi:hypothetical protein